MTPVETNTASDDRLTPERAHFGDGEFTTKVAFLTLTPVITESNSLNLATSQISANYKLL